MQRIVFSLILLIASAMSSLSMAQDKKFSFDFRNEALTEVIKKLDAAENGGYPPTQNGDIRSLFLLFSLMAMQN